MDAEEALKHRDGQYRQALAQIGGAIGYGNAQQILGDLWDAMLEQSYGFGGRGAMGVTVDDKLPPVPKATSLRRKQQGHGGYCMVPSYSVDEMKAYAHAAIRKALAEQSANVEA